MRTGRQSTWLPTDLRESDAEARATVRHLLRATRADLADMDQLLARAERLVSCGFVADRSLHSCSTSDADSR